MKEIDYINVKNLTTIRLMIKMAQEMACTDHEMQNFQEEILKSMYRASMKLEAKVNNEN